MQTIEQHLAQTEPMPDGYRMANRCYLGPVVDRRPDATAYGLPLPGGAAEALTDALSLFIESL